MSSDVRRPLSMAKEVGAEAVAMLSDTVTWAGLAGSVRRGKPMVGDIEIVVLADDVRAMCARLDKLVLDGVIAKARYGDIYRWGEKYRGFEFRDWRVEVFSSDPDNFGYIHWLRTGPSDANEFVMRRLAEADSPYRARGGYWWRDGRKLRVADETELFRLLGVPYLAPHERELNAYRYAMRAFEPVNHVVWAEDDTPAPVQKTMF